MRKLIFFFALLILISPAYADRIREVGTGNNELMEVYTGGSELRYWFIPPTEETPSPSGGGGGGEGRTESEIANQIKTVKKKLVIPAFSTIDFLKDIGLKLDRASALFKFSLLFLVLMGIVFRKELRTAFKGEDDEKEEEKDIMDFLVGEEEKKKK